MNESEQTQLEPTPVTDDFGCVRVELGKSLKGATEFIEVTSDGVFHCSVTDREIEGEVPIIERRQITWQPVSAVAQTVPIDAQGAHGLIVQYRTTSGRLERQVVPSAAFQKNGALPTWLAEHGIAYDPKYVNSLRRYFALAQPTTQVVAYNRTGWNVAPSGTAVFVLGEVGVLGAVDASVYQPVTTTSTANLGQSGTLAEWIDNLGRPACAVPWWRFGIMAALAAPLLKVLDEVGRGFHVVGQTSKGKSIGGACGASVFGKGSKHDSDSFVITWNTTRNGIENVCEAHSDLALVLDELGEADAPTVANLIYLITGGVGRTRMKGDTSMQQRKNWRVILLSTGEQSLASKVREAGQHFSAGMGVRIVEISVDHTGFTQTIDIQVVRAIEAAVQRYYGTAGPAFIERLVTEGYGDPASAVVAALKSRLEEIERDLVGTDSDQRRRRAARSFAIAQVAGELGVQWGILPKEIVPDETCKLAYNIWRESAGTRNIDDTRMAAGRLLQLIDQQMNVTIVRLDAATRDGESEGGNRERRGWFDGQDNALVVYLLPATLEQALGGYSQKTFVEETARLGIFMPGDGRNLQAKVPKMGRYRPRAYKIDYYRLQEFCTSAPVEPRQPSDEREAVGNGKSGTPSSNQPGQEPALPSCFGNPLDGLERCLVDGD
jgi:putative DNA primase/helicase